MSSRNASKADRVRLPEIRRAGRVGLAAVIGATVLAVLPALASAGLPLGRPACPLRFDEETTGLPRTCVFVGHFSGAESGEVLAAFAGDGETLVIAMARGDATPLLYLPAEAVSPTAGTLLRWEAGVQPAASADSHAVSDEVVGAVTLEDGGRRLRVRATGADGGPPAEFVGYFAAMVDAADEPVVSRR